ncbi:MAG TPA: hypothetical protein VES67_00705 [Vicinamibacterales bacterium]|nr:hypothetical protein [Vicinamibacterales bacterium]
MTSVRTFLGPAVPVGPTSASDKRFLAAQMQRYSPPLPLNWSSSSADSTLKLVSDP